MQLYAEYMCNYMFAAECVCSAERHGVMQTSSWITFMRWFLYLITFLSCNVKRH